MTPTLEFNKVAGAPEPQREDAKAHMLSGKGENVAMNAR
jgi:hypothetical protein